MYVERCAAWPCLARHGHVCNSRNPPLLCRLCCLLRSLTGTIPTEIRMWSLLQNFNLKANDVSSVMLVPGRNWLQGWRAASQFHNLLPVCEHDFGKMPPLACGRQLGTSLLWVQ